MSGDGKGADMDYSAFPLFSALDPEQVESLFAAGRENVIAAGETFIREGDTGNCIFFVFAGSMTVYSENDGEERELASIHAPAVIGELEAFTGDPRSACVRARTEVRALELPFETLRSRLQSGDPAAFYVVFHTAQIIARRLAAMNKKFLELQQQPNVRHDELREFQDKLLNDWSI